MLLRKALVLAVSVFLADNEYGFQVNAVMWIMCAATVLQLVCKPDVADFRHAVQVRGVIGVVVARILDEDPFREARQDQLGPRVSPATVQAGVDSGQASGRPKKT